MKVTTCSTNLHVVLRPDEQLCVLTVHAHPDDEASKRPVAPEEYAEAATLLGARISTRKPAAYLTREAWLQGVPFYVDERVIVPRSLIAELLVDGGIDYWLLESTHKVLDLCTGNGSLGILAAMVYPDVVVTANVGCQLHLGGRCSAPVRHWIEVLEQSSGAGC